MDNYVKRTNTNAERQAMSQEPELRLVDAIDILEEQQCGISNLVTALNYRISGEEPKENIGIDALSYVERMKRLIKYNEDILFSLSNFNALF
jgi:hypothetical protein